MVLGKVKVKKHYVLKNFNDAGLDQGSLFRDCIYRMLDGAPNPEAQKSIDEHIRETREHDKMMGK